MKNTFCFQISLVLVCSALFFTACNKEASTTPSASSSLETNNNITSQLNLPANTISSLSTTDGHILLLGSRLLPEQNIQVFLLTKINSITQEVIWEEQVGSLDHEFHYPQKLIQTTEGYAAIGFADHFNTGKMEAMLVLINESGNWSRKFYETTGDIRAYDIVETDRELLIIGEGRSNDEGDIIIITTNKKGGRISTKSIPKNGQQTLRSMTKSHDNGYIAVGTQKGIEQENVYLVKFNKHFHIDWEKTFQYTIAETTNTIIEAYPNGYRLSFLDQDHFYHTVFLHNPNAEPEKLSAHLLGFNPAQT